MQAVRPRLPDAAHALRLSRRGHRLSASRLSEVWQVYSGLSHEDYDIETLSNEQRRETRTAVLAGEPKSVAVSHRPHHPSAAHSHDDMGTHQLRQLPIFIGSINLLIDYWTEFSSPS